MKPVTYIVNRNKDENTYSIYCWQHKAKPYEDALVRTGWKKHTGGDVFLLDHDLNPITPNEDRNAIRTRSKMGSMIVLYPHSVLPEWWYGVEHFPSPLVAFRFVIAEAQRLSLEMTYPEVKAEIGGWGFTDIKPYQPCSSPRKILFAAIHPPKYLSLRPEGQRANRQVIAQLDQLKNNYEIRVRYLGDLAQQGLEEVPGMDFVQGQPDGSTEDIEWADIVIADQTFMFIAAALGKPIIGMRQGECPRGNNLETKRSDDWKTWWHLVRYPLSHNEETMKNLIKEACSNEFAEWKQMNIGERMQPKRIDAIIKRYLKEYRRN